MDAAISLRNVTKSFGSHTVLQDISFDIPRGKVSAVMGPSGTGKSVLLKNVIGLLRPYSGEIWVDGEETVRMRTSDNELIRQFLAGRAMGPIGMDELAEERTEIEIELANRERLRMEAAGQDVDDYGVMTV